MFNELTLQWAVVPPLNRQSLSENFKISKESFKFVELEAEFTAHNFLAYRNCRELSLQAAHCPDHRVSGQLSFGNCTQQWQGTILFEMNFEMSAAPSIKMADLFWTCFGFFAKTSFQVYTFQSFFSLHFSFSSLIFISLGPTINYEVRCFAVHHCLYQTQWGRVEFQSLRTPKLGYALHD